MSAYILIIWLAGGGLSVRMEPDLQSCAERLRFEIQFDPTRKMACVRHEGSEA